MPDNQQPISYYVEEAKRLGLSAEQQSVIGDETDGQAFREHIANAHDKSDEELRTLLGQEWENYSVDHSGEDGEGFDAAAQAEDEANGRHADSEPEGDEEDADELDDEDDDFASDEEEDDADWDEEDEEDSSDEDDGESSEEPEEDSLDHLDFDEEAVERKRDGGGEAIEGGEADCEGCKI